MAPDIEQLRRIQALATQAGLLLGEAHPAEFAAGYKPVRYRQFELPPAFVWLCTLCDPQQSSRIFIPFTALGEPSPLEQTNDELRHEESPWPDNFVAFAFTGDEVFCFAYNSLDTEPAVVMVDSYSSKRDWQWYRDSFESWLAIQADWLPKSDARMATWLAKQSRKQSPKQRDK